MARRKNLRGAILRRLVKQEILGDVRARMRAADAQTVREGVEIAQSLSAGTWSLAALARRPYPNHPYARSHPNAAFDPGVINRQTGKFQAGWHVRPNPNLPPALWNTSRVARYLEFGTKSMVARPIDKLIIARLGPIRKRNLDLAFQRDGTLGATPSLAAS